MKVIFGNKYVRCHQFGDKRDFDKFFSNQNNLLGKLLLDEQGGEFWYCYLIHDSLTSDKLYAFGFDSDESHDRLNFFYWKEENLCVFDNGSMIFIVDESMNILNTFDIITPLIGFYLTDSGSLLVLEEASMKLIGSNGAIVKNEQFDLINDYHVSDNALHITMDSTDRIISL